MAASAEYFLVANKRALSSPSTQQQQSSTINLMATPAISLTKKVESGSPYQLSQEQVLKASTALLGHIKGSAKETASSAGKKDLLADVDDEEKAQLVWLLLSTKKHIAGKTSLKPKKIAIPHSINTSENGKICLIVADPQRTYKDIVASPAFPSALAGRISKVVGLQKILKKHKTYEAQRKLKAEHDIFLADDRIITFLPKALGKTFYGSTTKRPLPITLSQPQPKTVAKRTAHAGGKEQRTPATPQQAAKEIEAALSSTLLNLSPSVSTSIKVGYSNWDPKKLAENVEAASNALIQNFVAKKWRGVKSIQIKGERTATLPIWLADELWEDENDVLNEQEAEQIAQANVGKKRKAVQAVKEDVKDETKQKVKSTKKQKLIESKDDALDREIALRKEKLKKQKEEAAKDAVDEVPKPSKSKRVKQSKGEAK
ncbi:ribosomal protein L1p/L10e family-domain-containing protein [Amylocarpus encephaloides]|uniref:Ribosomal protein L1p/L10e family-domain-containing protein n=1 Tax=Amylocarpus encephaloides TaxID=45428 RepID=A0A9P8C689_9HELO|nr:ribosomal protein L1p/L10e family-domain-containing protein [Amylocarpus encephaloides]